MQIHRVASDMMTKKHPMKNTFTRRGFTIIEVVVAVFLVAAGIAMATSLLVRSTQVAEHSRAVTAASLIARSHMDRLCQASFAELISDRFQRNEMGRAHV